MSEHSRLAEAIAHAEGFSLPKTIPTKAHNPGDLVLGDKGHGTIGSEGITIFEDDATGWAALEHQLTLIREYKSHVYTPMMTIQQMADKWTRTQRLEWAQNVAGFLSRGGRIATIDTQIRDVI